MTVKELQEELKNQNPEAKVVIQNLSDGREELLGVIFKEDGPNVISGRTLYGENCCILIYDDGER